MIRIRFFGPGELIQNYFRAARYVTTVPTRVFGSAGMCIRLDAQDHQLRRSQAHLWRRRADAENSMNWQT